MGCEDNPLCEYKSTKFIRVRNPRLVAIYYTVIVLVLVYVVFYTVYWDYGYQQFDQVVGTTSAKVKGTASTGDFHSLMFNETNETIIYDAMDVIVPGNEENALFVTTSHIITSNQSRGVCDGNSDVDSCTSNDNCTLNEYNTDSQGILTGECGTNGFCQVYSWCPLENDEDPTVLNNIGNFTVFVKIDIQFSEFDVTRSNTIDKNGNGAPIDGYNLWTVNDILDEATDGEIKDYNQIATHGAIVLMVSEWNCNLDKAVKHCNPKYTFTRIDGESDSISTGYNFRDVQYDVTNTRRLLRKLYGLRVVFVTDGTGGQFSISALSVTFGAGLAYLGVAKIITDLVLEKFLPKSHKYDEMKNQLIEDKDLLSGDSYHSYLRYKQQQKAEQQQPGTGHDEENNTNTNIGGMYE